MPRENGTQIVIDTGSSVADLRTRWHKLCDLDRARAVQSIHRAGVSLRGLALHLNCSPSLLSHLLRAARASAEDRELARSGAISTRELVRRTGSSATRPRSIHGEAIAFDCEYAAVQAGQAITNWFDEQKVASTDRQQVIAQACSYQASADMPDLGSLGAYLPDIPLDEVIRLFRPAHIENDGNHSVAWFAEWLALWTLHGVLDDRVRTRALDLALDERPQS